MLDNDIFCFDEKTFILIIAMNSIFVLIQSLARSARIICHSHKPKIVRLKTNRNVS